MTCSFVRLHKNGSDPPPRRRFQSLQRLGKGHATVSTRGVGTGTVLQHAFCTGQQGKAGRWSAESDSNPMTGREKGSKRVDMVETVWYGSSLRRMVRFGAQGSRAFTWSCGPVVGLSYTHMMVCSTRLVYGASPLCAQVQVVRGDQVGAMALLVLPT